MADQAQPSEVHELVRRRLADNGVRYTGGRRAVVTSIQMASGPRTAAQLLAASTHDVPASSLYRTLVVLETCDVIRKQHGPDGAARYELAESLTGHHHHVVCVACGAIEDVVVSKSEERHLHDVVESLGAQAGFRILDHVLEVEGVCPSCDE